MPKTRYPFKSTEPHDDNPYSIRLKIRGCILLNRWVVFSFLVLGILLPLTSDAVPPPTVRGSSASILASQKVPISFKPFNSPPNHQDVNLYRIEVNHFARSTPVIAPNYSGYAYSEVYFLPEARQTISKLFYVPLPAGGLPKTVENPLQLTSWFDPNQTLKRRTSVYNVGDVRPRNYAFDTLTPIDWSHDSTKLLIKRRAGVIYTGLRCSDVLVWDKTQGLLSVYAELVHALAYHWRNTENQSAWNAPAGVEQMAWDIEPLGWKQKDATTFYWRGWAFTQQNGGGRYNLGLWQYNTVTQTTELVSPNGKNLPYDLASNGLMAVVKPQAPTVVAVKKKHWLEPFHLLDKESWHTTLGSGVETLKAPPPPMR
jgi:hypothetical protein